MIMLRYTAHCDISGCEGRHDYHAMTTIPGNLPPGIDLPHGWTLINKGVICQKHKVEIAPG